MPTTRLKSRALGVAAAVGAAAALAGILPAAGSASQVTATLSNAAPHQYSRVTVTTALSSSPMNADREYGAQFTLPPALGLDYYAAIGGSYGNTCTVSAFTQAPALTTGFTPAGFNKSFAPQYCPNTAKVGTVTLGTMSGSLYIVNISPVPMFAIYFNQGVTTPWGRRIALNWNADGSSTWTVYGLPNMSSSGLSITFGNPASPNALQRAIFWNEPYNNPDADGSCQVTQPVTGAVWTFPLFGVATERADLTPSTVSFTGCD